MPSNFVTVSDCRHGGVQDPHKFPPWDELPTELLSKVASGRDALKAMRLVCSTWQTGFSESVTKLCIRYDADFSLLEVRKAFPRLKQLCLNGYDLPSDVPRDLSVDGPSIIQSLSFLDCSGVTAALLSGLQDLPVLRSLQILATDIDGSGIETLRNLSSLVDLTLQTALGVRLGGIPLLHGLPLTRLDLRASEPLVPEAVAALRGLSSLRDLRLVGSSIPEGCITELYGLPLAKLDLSGMLLTVEGLTALGGLPQLQDLVLCGCLARRFSDDSMQPGFAALRGLPLTRLDVGLLHHGDGGDHVCVYDECLTELSDLPLTDLRLDGCAITDVGLSALRNMPLRKLSLSNCPAITGMGIAATFPGMPLKFLYLCCEGINGMKKGLGSWSDFASVLANLPLAKLTLESCQFSICDDSLAPLRRSRTLRRLEIDYCPMVSNDSIPVFLAMSSLVWLVLRGSSVTLDGEAQLRKSIQHVNA